MGYTLIITEKPTAARTIAEALCDKPKKHEHGKAFYYEFKIGKKKFITAPAVGHLFTLRSKAKNYPVFDVEWIPSYETKQAAFTKEYFDNLKNLAKHAKDFIVATDYDTEGDVIAYNILRFLCNRNDAKRMKFSTMTKEELRQSYENILPHMDFNQIESGLTRHYLDHYWGVSLSKALISAIKQSGRRFRILSTGRVQGPVLHFLAKHEHKIKAFKPKPFWQILAEIKIGKQIFKAGHEKDKIWNKNEADEILRKLGREAIVKDIKKKIFSQRPPKPYDTTTFLTDAYRFFGYSPQQAMNIAESLYQAGLISYPRTASQKLPPDINYRKILSSLAKQDKYKKDAEFLLGKKELKPEEGKKTDPAHPAIYVTSEIPKKLGDLQQKIYDLIARRFLAVFGDPAKRESQKISLDVNGEIFFLSGIKTIEPGWTKLYGRYAAREEVLLPEINIGDKFSIKRVEQLEKETQPPQRYSQGSVIREMEQRGLGTKATRALILQILYNRGYIIGKSIEVTELGLKLSDILEKNVPDIVSERLTRHFEKECEDVQTGKITREKVLMEARKTLIKISEQFRKKEKKIGEELVNAIIESQEKQSILGQCPKCNGILKVHKFWKTGNRFVGCSNFKKGCDFSAPLPRFGTLIKTENICKECKTPIIQVQIPGRRPFRMCLDLKCPTKKDWFDKRKIKRRIAIEVKIKK